jgi:glycosyltransferase involved in cell wall biosynthesis
MTNGIDVLILQDPNDIAGLAERARKLYEQPELRERIAEQAAVTAGQYTWDHSGVEMRATFDAALSRKRSSAIWQQV